MAISTAENTAFKEANACQLQIMTRALLDTSAQYPNYLAEKSKQFAHISSSALAAKREKHGISTLTSFTTPAPTLSTSRPSTAVLTLSHPPTEHGKSKPQVEKDKPRILAPVSARRKRLPISKSTGNLLTSANQDEESLQPTLHASTEAPAPTKVRASRGVAIRGDLGFLPAENMLDEPGADDGHGQTSRPKTSAGFVVPFIEKPDPVALQDVTLSARPRSRFARRESSRWQAQVRTLERIATAPVLDQPSSFSSRDQMGAQSAAELGSIGSGRHSDQPQLRVTGSNATSSSALATAWDEVDIANFFLTELDKTEKQKDGDEEVERQQRARKEHLATSIADAWYLLYGFRQWEPALGRLSDAIATAELLAAQGNNPTYSPLVGLLHHHAGVALKELGRTKLAIAAQKRALDASLSTHDRRLQARAVKALGVLLLDGHHMQSALEHQQEALSIALEEKDRDLEARVYANLGNIAAAQLRFGHAIACHERDLRLSQSPLLNSAIGVARAHRNLAVVYGRLQKRALQQRHEMLARELEEGASAFEQDVDTHAIDGVGNPVSQLSIRDAELVELVAESLRSAIDTRRGPRLRSSVSPERQTDRGVSDDAQKLQNLHAAPQDRAKSETLSRPRRPSVTLRINNYPLE